MILITHNYSMLQVQIRHGFAARGRARRGAEAVDWRVTQAHHEVQRLPLHADPHSEVIFARFSVIKINFTKVFSRLLDFMSFLPGKIALKNYLKSFKDIKLELKGIFPHCCVHTYGISTFFSNFWRKNSPQKFYRVPESATGWPRLRILQGQLGAGKLP